MTVGGALLLHGFGGSPATMAPLSVELVGAGVPVAVPHLAVDGDWASWSAAAGAALGELAGTGPVVVVGQSMGAALGAVLCAEHPATVAGLVAINPLVSAMDPDTAEYLAERLARGRTELPADPPDLRDPQASEPVPERVPVASLLSLHAALPGAVACLPDVRVPVLVLVSAWDRVATPGDADRFAALVAGPVRRVELPRSGHVATLDLDRDLVVAEVLAFCARA